jgi:hypothetical protein
MPPPDPTSLVDVARVPSPERARILQEIAADFEDMRAELMRRGMDAPEAEAEAHRLLAPSDTAITALASVHEPFYASLARRFSTEMRLAEWLVLVGVTLAAIGLSVEALLRSGLLRTPSPLLWPLLAVTGVVLVRAGRKAIQLLVARDHEPARLHDGMGSLLIASGLAVVLGFGGATYEALRLADRLERAPERTGELVPRWLLDTSVLLGAGLATALIGGLAWFLLQQKISTVERADVQASEALRRATASTFPMHPTQPRTGVRP